MNVIHNTTAQSLLTKAAHQPEIQHLNLFQLAGFIATCQEMLPSIRQRWREQQQRHSESLPANILSFLSIHLKINLKDVEKCWQIFSQEIMAPVTMDCGHIVGRIYASGANVQRLWSLNLGE